MFELIVEGNFCLYQDYIWFILFVVEEQVLLKVFQEVIDDLLDYLKANYMFCEYFKVYFWFICLEVCLEVIYENFLYFFVFMIVLEGIGGVVFVIVIGIIGVDDSLIFEMNFEWLEMFFNEVFYKDFYFEFLIEQFCMVFIYWRLWKVYVIECWCIYLEELFYLECCIWQSSSKLYVIVVIVWVEYGSMGSSLWLLVFIDYI